MVLEGREKSAARSRVAGILPTRALPLVHTTAYKEAFSEGGFKEHTLGEVAGRDTFRLESAGIRSTAALDDSVAAASSRLCTTEVRGSIPLDTTRIRADLQARTSVQENVRTSARCAAPSVVAP